MTLDLGVMVAAGVLGTDGLGSGLPNNVQNKLDAFKYIVTKSVTNYITKGTPQPNRTSNNRYQLEGTTLNNVNLRSPGLWDAERLINNIAQDLKTAKLVGSIPLENADDIYKRIFTSAFNSLNNNSAIHAIEINLGCHSLYNPFTKPLDNAKRIADAISYHIIHLPKALTKPIWLKLPPDTYFVRQIVDNKDILQLCGLIVSNSYAGKIYQNNIEMKTNVENSGIGVSMSAMKYMNYKLIDQLRSYVPDTTKIIGCGGVSNVQDVQDYIQAGANGVQIGSLFLHQPETAIAIARTFYQ